MGVEPADSRWLFSWPLLACIATYLYCLHLGKGLLIDGDTYWHIAVGRWITSNGSIPSADPFSHSMSGGTWTAHEWLSEIILATAYRYGDWTGVVTVTAFVLAAAIGLLARALLRWFESIYAILFTVLALSMSIGHLVARPHVLAMPLLVMWTIELVRARDEGRSPRLWMLPLMVAWANVHGSFTLGIALAFAFSIEAVIDARSDRHRRKAAIRTWGFFMVSCVAAALLTPHGARGIWFTWEVLMQGTYALQIIEEWQSPDFHSFQPLELWLLSGLAVLLHQGLRLPPVRSLIVLGLLHLSLKHARNIELLGLLVPLVIAPAFAAQWRERQRGRPQLQRVDRLLASLCQPAGTGALALGLASMLALPIWFAGNRPVEIPEEVAPLAAIRAAQAAGITGPVLNAYEWGGYLIFASVPPFVDGRADLYGDAFLREYRHALQLTTRDGLDKLIEKYGVTWTLLAPGTPANALIDRMPGWIRVHADPVAVVYAKRIPDAGPCRREHWLPTRSTDKPKRRPADTSAPDRNGGHPT